MEFAGSAVSEGGAEVRLAETVSRFVERNGLDVVVVSDSPGECVVVVDFSPCNIGFSVVVDVSSISELVREDDRKGNSKDIGASLVCDRIEERCGQPSSVYKICSVVAATA